MLAPGDTIGILGGGQLGRMLCVAASRFGLRAHVYCPDADSPAFDVCCAKTVAAYEDEAALAAFAQAVDVVTYEFENVPARTAEVLAGIRPVRPDAAALAASQDRLVEKEFVNSLGIRTAPYVNVDTAGSLARAVAQLGRPSILKTRRFGYDGKGQTTIKEGTDLAVAFRSLGGVPAILEGLVPFTKEISVIGARGLDGSFAAFDVCENEHANHILHRTVAPAGISSETAARAVDIARTIADALHYVGVLAVAVLRDARGRRRGVARQRDRATRAQFGALDRGRRRHVAIRAARARHRRLAARRDDAARRRRRDAEPRRRGGGRLA